MVKVEGDKEVTGETITNSIGNGGSSITLNDDLDVNSNNLSNITTAEADTVQLNPQTPAPAINNSLWVDSGDSNKLKHRDNGGTSYEVVDFSHVGTGANQLVQLDGSGALPAVDGSNLTNIPTGVDYQTVTGSTDISTASTSYVDVTDMSITVSESGTYLVIGTMTTFHDLPSGAVNVKNQCQLYNSTTATSLHETTQGIQVGAATNGAQSEGTHTIHWIGSLTASDVIKLRWKIVTGLSGTIYNRPATQADFRRLSILKLA
jgi:hypothetical protein